MDVGDGIHLSLEEKKKTLVELRQIQKNPETSWLVEDRLIREFEDSIKKEEEARATQ